MAIIDAEQISKAAQGFSRLSIVQQLTVLIGISLSIALGVSVALWSSKPNLVPMYAQLDPSDTAQVIDVLQKSDIDYEYSQGNGTVLVPANMVYELRMKLAAQGLPKSSTGGYELLDKPQGFGTSQYMESIKVRRSMEGELAKTITGLESVRNARVHLGMAKQSSFIRKSSVSSAAVMVELIPGYILDRGQVMGIVNLVSASVPGLDKNSVSVVDQRGNLLTGAKAENGAVATEQLDYVKQRESELSHKILKLLEPIYGKNAVMASVNADLDFTYNEITSENYEHDNPAVRKESTAQEGGGRSGQSGGVPGALSNSPPKAATTSSGSSQDTNEDFSEQSEPSGNYRIQTNRQYEVDRSIKYTKQMTGKVLRVTTAVVINDKVSYDQNANPTFTPIDPDEISRIESLVKDAVGFNAERGDTISVINSSFAKQPPMIEDPNLQTPMYKQDWFTTLVKQILSGVLIIIIMLSFIKPLINGIINSKKNDINEMNSKNSSSQGNSLELEDKDEMLQLPGPDEKVLKIKEHAKELAHDNSKEAAQVVMNWIGRDNE